ncbi:MAG: FxsA family protein [Pseudonocardiaceae bacterium]
MRKSIGIGYTAGEHCMRRMASFAGLFLVVLGFVEIAGIVLVATWIGNTSTVILLLASAIVGFWVLRRHGARALRVLQERDSSTHAPTAVTGFLLGAVAGGLLILPGFLTSAVAALLLLPPFRRALARRSLRRFTRWMPASVSDRLNDPLRVRSHRATPPPTHQGSGHTTTNPEGEGGVDEADHMIVISPDHAGTENSATKKNLDTEPTVEGGSHKADPDRP